MKYVGAHVSMAGGIYNSVLNAKRIGAKSFALFTKNQKQWVGKPITPEDAERFSSELKASGYSAASVLPHDSYLINLGHPDKDKLQKSREAFQDEMKRCMKLGLRMLNFHPGSHLGMITIDNCLSTISDSINYALDKSDNVTAVIENTAGQGNTVGNKFEHLRQIIDGVEDKNRVGVCIDTCHAFASGYDLRSKETYENVWDQFSQIVGFKYLKAMHINDSKKEYNSRVDRHASLGKGEIGINCFKYIMNDSRMEEIPLILETPDSEIWQQEIKMLYDFYRDEK